MICVRALMGAGLLYEHECATHENTDSYRPTNYSSAKKKIFKIFDALKYLNESVTDSAQLKAE